jgi:hypothetical protein
MLPLRRRFASGSSVPFNSPKSGVPLSIQFSYLGGEQFWGRAVRASRDSLDPGRFLFAAKFPSEPQSHTVAVASRVCLDLPTTAV